MVDRIEYGVDPNRAWGFYASIRTYWPGLQIERPGGSNTDFVIQDAKTHGVHGLINLFGIESPGLTSSLAIAEYVAVSA